MAADMPLKAPPRVAATVFSWTGFYVGVEGGWGDAQNHVTRNVANASYPVGYTFDLNGSGAMYGFEAGANYQFQYIVLGVEGDIQGSSIKNTTTIFSPINTNFSTVTREVDWVSTVTGRLGLAWDRWMIFGKGGAAWRRIDEGGSTNTFSAAGALLATTKPTPDTQFGYVVGGGVEWAAADNISLKVEYDWYNFGTNSSTANICMFGASCGGVGAIVPAGETSASSTMWELKGAINFHFNWLPSAPVVARY